MSGAIYGGMARSALVVAVVLMHDSADVAELAMVVTG